MSAVLAAAFCQAASAGSQEGGEPGQASKPQSVTSPQQLFETNCGACHSLELPRSQRLDRNTWRWVVDDMVNQFGATWITEEQQRIIVDYLAENYGPDRPREPAAEP
ncbi:MAG: cytochrome c [Gammaproteobacteria bacterium]|jgi:mono/diheme cytochrome c family protein